MHLTVNAIVAFCVFRVMAMMTKKEAAVFVGVSVRALERYSNQGKLTVHQRKGKTRPVVLYDEEELIPLKKEVDARFAPRGRPASVPASEATETVGFRLDAYYRKRLAEEAEQRGMSAGEYARRLVVRALEDNQGHESAREVAELRKDLAVAVKALLCFAGKVEPDEAGQWVRNNLFSEGR